MEFSTLLDRLGSLVQAHSLATMPKVNPEILGVAAINASEPQTISYVEGTKFASAIQTTASVALILPADGNLQLQASQRGLAWLSVLEPRLAFAKTIALFYQPFRPQPQIHASAVVHESAQLGKNVYLGPHVVVEAGCVLADDVCIHSNSVLYPGVSLGSNTILHANCTIHERVQIGPNCVIHSGAVIGSEGFGFVPTATGWVKMEQSGVVVLEAGVEVGCNSTIDRPAVGETRIKAQTKIDNLVHIAHGCEVGQNCALAAQVGLAGGVTVGNQVLLAGQVGVANQTRIGDQVVASAQSGLHGVIGPGQTISGTPYMPHEVYLKASAVYKRLPEMYQVLKRREKPSR